MSRKATPEEVEQVIAAIAKGGAIVCYTRCWPCQFDDHFDPPEVHTWMDEEDAAHAGLPVPLSAEDQAAHPCGCYCGKAKL